MQRLMLTFHNRIERTYRTNNESDADAFVKMFGGYYIKSWVKNIYYCYV